MDLDEVNESKDMSKSYNESNVFVKRSYQCDQCNHVANYKLSLKKHKQSNHEGLLFMCDTCEKTYGEKSHLAAHIKEIHLGVRYPCDQCDYKATRKGYIRFHKAKKHPIAETSNKSLVA